MIAYINRLIRQGWTDNGVSPSRPATDNEWVRRVYLDMLGRIPSVDEANDVSSPSTGNDRKAKLVDKLLYSDEYTEDYARNWTTIWTNILIGRNGGQRQPLADQPRGDAEVPAATRSPATSRTTRWSFELVTATGTTRRARRTSTAPSTS